MTSLTFYISAGMVLWNENLCFSPIKKDSIYFQEYNIFTYKISEDLNPGWPYNLPQEEGNRSDVCLLGMLFPPGEATPLKMRKHMDSLAVQCQPCECGHSGPSKLASGGPQQHEWPLGRLCKSTPCWSWPNYWPT